MNLIVFAILLLNGPLFVRGATNRSFPPDFKFGVATSAYQIEGGWNADGKGENIWDHAAHTNPSLIKNNDSGDIACDSYHKYKEDVRLLQELGVSFYRFSISWSRILPTGFANEINQAGVDYYVNLLKELQAAGIEPMVTLYHWDLPQPLQDIGGWPNPVIADIFAEYARVCFKLFGGHVKTWFTINEAQHICHRGHGVNASAPFIQSGGFGEYLCGHTILLGHAKAYHIYDKEFRAEQHGRISIVTDTFWYEAATNSSEDVAAAERNRQFYLGWFAHPVFKGNYPQVMIDRIAKRSKEQGFSKSRLPVFSPEEISLIRGTADFFSLNTYTTFLIKDNSNSDPKGAPNLNDDAGTETLQHPEWPESASKWLRIVPRSIRKLLNWIHTNYDHPEIIITENGVSDTNGELNDHRRVGYFKEYLSNILLSRLEDGVNVTAYTAWTLIDAFEWWIGYTETFGLYYVDFNDKSRTRIRKKSAEYYKKVISTRCLVDVCDRN